MNISTLSEKLNRAFPGTCSRVLESVDSTNSECRRLIEKWGGGTFVVFAGSQTAGRGRLDRSFLCQPGKGLYMSLGFEAGCGIEKLSEFSCIAGVAAARVLRRLGYPARLKWPNDIYISGKKLGGILLEFIPAGTYPQGAALPKEGQEAPCPSSPNAGSKSPGMLITGIGINVSQTDEDLLALGGRATSLLLEINSPETLDFRPPCCRHIPVPGPEALGMLVLIELIKLAEELGFKADKTSGGESMGNPSDAAGISDPGLTHVLSGADILREYTELSYTLGKRVSTGSLTGTAVSINRDYSLRIELQSGELRDISFGDVNVL